ncbi:Ig-like domain-containing domain [Daejeonella oryzae]|uniref:Ig-like domain-containing domain n=1 Tax=Daejeonella oryzae TaxID=1122943 RepID=UPI0004787AAC|nr:Ig-like domain-containing domain [Daejeonella oryzae]
MAKNKILQFHKIISLHISIIFFVSGCASVQQPNGGPKDTQAPKVTKEVPGNLTKNFKSERIEIQFNEFVKLNNEFSEISISPAVDEMPIFKARKNILDIKFDKPLEERTTYTINFGKSIGDVNENNLLKNYTYVFSTGDQIDSLSISGTVSNSLTKEKLKDATVFILPVSRDSIFGKKRANIFTTTDSSGNFELKNLREDKYLLYALLEQSGDRIYNSPEEEIGFIKDTLNLNKNIKDLTIEVFKEQPDIFRVLDKKIENDGRILVAFNLALKNPSLEIIEPKGLNSEKTTEFSSKMDSAIIWLPNLTFDSLKVSLSDQGKAIDTISIYRNKKDTYKRAVSVSDNMPAAKLKPGTNPQLIFTSPLASFDQSKITLLLDSSAVKTFQIVKDSTSSRRYVMKNSWKQGKEYDLKLAEGAFSDIYGNKSKVYSRKFTVDTEENYGNIAIEITVPDTSKTYVIQWLNEQNVLLRKDVITKNTVLNYNRYPTAKYKIRVVYDANKNGLWDTGSIKLKLQPEKVWNFDKVLTLRPNWDLEEKLIIPPLE